MKLPLTARALTPAVMMASLVLTGSQLHAGTQADAEGTLSTTDAGAGSGNSADDLAKKLANPIAAMISIPFQNNFDWGAGPQGDGFQWKMNLQPVIPISLNDDWNLITRTILPVISQTDVAGTILNPSGSQTGLGDTLFSGWFSPTQPTSSGWILGIGPALGIPTGTNALLGSEKWTAGPTAIALKQSNGWTYGGLANHVWDFAGDSNRSAVNSTFIQPFLSLNRPGGWTYSINSESLYNWQSSQWTVPVNLMVSKLVTINRVPVQFQVGGRYYVVKPDQGPEWGLRLAVTFLLPK